METRRIVITGGPGSGKTALINYLASKEHTVMEEISRQVTHQAQMDGIEQLFLVNPILFSQKLLAGRLEQYHQGNDFEVPFIFYDRGMPDVIAYMDYVNTHYPDTFVETCKNFRYDLIFVLPPWEDIYENDNERYESFQEAEKIFSFLKNTYARFGYQVEEVPVGSIKERVDYILRKLEEVY